MTIFDGKAEAEKIKGELTTQLASVTKKPKLGIVLVEGNHSSAVYVARKQALAAELGIGTELLTLPKFDQNQIREKIKTWAADPEVSGIMVQLPLIGASSAETEAILEAIPLAKDIDGLNPENGKLISQGKQTFLPATVVAVEYILKQAKAFDRLVDKTWAIVGSEGMVGKPLSQRLKSLGIKVLELDQGEDLKQLKECAVVIACTGIPSLISGDYLKPGVVAIDVGFPAGDFEFVSVLAKASFITPVPGGVGPLTVAMLMANMVKTPNDAGKI